MVKMLTVLVSTCTITNSQVFLLRKNVKIAFAYAITFFQQNISVYAIFNDQSFNDALTKGMFSFEQLAPDFQNFTVFFFSFINLFVTSAL